MDEEQFALIFGIVAGLGIGILFTGIITSEVGMWNGEDELGQAICEEQYDMNYYAYDYEGLHCKPKVEAKQRGYNGIVINLGD